MTADFVTLWGSWLGLVASVFAVVAGVVALVMWARRQLRKAVIEDVLPLLEPMQAQVAEIAYAVNGVKPGDPRLVEQIEKAKVAAQLAQSMSEANGSKIEELSGKVSILTGDVQVLLGTTGFDKP